MSLQMLSMLRKWKAMVLGYSGAKEPNDIPPTYDRNVVDWSSAGSLVLFSLSLSLFFSTINYFYPSEARVLVMILLIRLETQ